MSRRILMAGLGILAAAAAVAAACSSDSSKQDEPPEGPFCEAAPAGNPANSEEPCDQRCPGGEGCEATADPTVFAGAAVEDITPVVDHVVVYAEPRAGDVEFRPLAGDKCVERTCAEGADPASCAAVDPARCQWMAGFGIGRSATGVADAASVRCVVVRQGETSIGLCAVDVIGWFYNEVQRTRELLRAEYPTVDLDLVIVGATHVHDMVDTMGQYGSVDGLTGIKKEYNELIRRKTAEALKRAHEGLVPVRVELGASRTDGHITETDPLGLKTRAYVSDTRDPVVIDDELRTIRFVSTADGKTVGTLLNYCAHPEIAGDENQLLSSDFVHTLREGVERGLEVKSASGATLYRAEGVGGVAVFFNGALGGQVGPGAASHTDFEGNPVGRTLEGGYWNGRKLAAYALEAIAGADQHETIPVGFRAREIVGTVKNGQFHIAIAQQLFDRDGEGYDRARPLGDDNLPLIRTQVAVIDLGPAELVTLPGELHAELLLATPAGGISTQAPYPFTPAPFYVLNDPETNPNCEWNATGDRCSCSDGAYCDDGPPDLSKLTPDEVIDLHRDPKAKYRWALGLTPDELGYIVPKYDYELDPQNPYFNEASPGDHYEETNSIGEDVQDHLVGPILQLLRSPAVVRR